MFAWLTRRRREVLRHAADMHDGHNVVLHEFAHQLDQESGAGNGAPLLPRRSMYATWARVLGHDFDGLVQQLERHDRTLIGQGTARRIRLSSLPS